ncbi:hypothetical protein SPI_04735 [Niveomyces insectorum RCEF 264]|uniref:Kinetochore protein n=1 Tax=Niveomyces insectorum RCEF 264 TaxID=1081102 RepID=A0A167USX9_9HYPO|nr:hypothetical protein SPI_04735 [Niveomyces insectorum RCEF 264]
MSSHPTILEVKQAFLERALYGAAAEADGEPKAAAADGVDVLDFGTDFTDSAAIAALPPTWDDPRDADAWPLETQRYAELVATLQEGAAARTAAAQRVRKLRRMATLLAPLASASSGDDENRDKADDGNAKNTLQANLVTRNGPVERELERMRVLLARVGDRVAALPRQGTTGADANASYVEDVETVGRARVQALLEQF